MLYNKTVFLKTINTYQSPLKSIWYAPVVDATSSAKSGAARASTSIPFPNAEACAPGNAREREDDLSGTRQKISRARCYGNSTQSNGGGPQKMTCFSSQI